MKWPWRQSSCWLFCFMVMQMISPFLSAYLFALWLKLESDQELWHCKSMLLKRSHCIVYFCIPKLKIMLHSSSTSFVYFWFDFIHHVDTNYGQHTNALERAATRGARCSAAAQTGQTGLKERSDRSPPAEWWRSLRTLAREDPSGQAHVRLF